MGRHKTGCGCAVLPEAGACATYKQSLCWLSDQAPLSPYACTRICGASDSNGNALAGCTMTWERPGDDDGGWGSPFVACDYRSTNACGCGTGLRKPVECLGGIVQFPCDGLSPNDAVNGFFNAAVCAKLCSYEGRTTGDVGACSPERDATGALVIRCHGSTCGPGRRPEGLVEVGAATGTPVGAYLAATARLEAASVDAFAILRAELAAFDAPHDLLERAARAREDEVRHARMATKLARRLGAEDGAWADPPEVVRAPTRSLESIAIENVVEGCVHETYAALLAVWQSEHAVDSDVRHMMRVIAEDETRHAALACAVARWIDGQLDEPARARVAAARDRALQALALHAAIDTPHGDLVQAGLAPTARQAQALVRALASTLSQTQPLVAAV